MTRLARSVCQRVAWIGVGKRLFRACPLFSATSFFRDGTHSLTWDSAHRLLQVNSSSGYWEAHRYDTHGRRVRTQRAGETVWSVYSRAGQLMFEQTASGNARRFVHLDERLVAQTRNGIRDYVHTDLVGTVRMQTDALANVTLEDVRAPYGSVLLGRSYRNGFAYAGHVESAGTGLTYMEARHYDPISMRFLSPDPVYVDFGSGANFNRYAYANNSPYKYVDPDRRLPILVPVVVFIAKEVAGEAVEQATGVPMPTAKTVGKLVLREAMREARSETLQGAAAKGATLKPGPFAKESIPGHMGKPTAAEQKQVNALMEKNGCHTCGTKNPGTKRGNSVVDHQPPQALGETKEFLPHCIDCMRRQGGETLQELVKRANN